MSILAALPYRRPRSRWARLISRPLGPLPADLPWVGYDRAEFAAAPSNRWLGVLAAILVVGAVATVITFVPVLGTTPVTLAFGVDWGGWVTIVLITVLLVAMPIIARRRSGRSLPALVHQLALNEELWFRAGSERWTVGQRLYSCAAFGFVHLTNLIYSLATCGVLIAVGGLFMLVYRHRHQVTGDTRQAVVAAAKVHATYNLVLGAVLYLAVTGYWVLTIGDLVAGRL